MQYKTIKSRGESKYNPQRDESEIAILFSRGSLPSSVFLVFEGWEKNANESQ